MNSTERRRGRGDEKFNRWIDEVIAQTGDHRQFEDACDLYNFAMAYDRGDTAKRAWRDYQEWINA